MTTRFDPISRQTVAEGVREALLDVIRRGHLAPGAQLPAERALCEQFAVARTSVREAIQGLVTLGVIERRGNRAYVVEHLPGVGLDDSEDARKRKVTDIFEVRRVVEVPIAELAARRATDEEREQISRLSQRFEAGMGLDDFRRCDREFHAAVAMACRNPALAELYAKVLDSLFKSTDFDSLLTASQNEKVVRQVIRDATDAHLKIARSLAVADVEAVGKAVEEHLNQVETLMIAQMT
jgi:GntR family transcriptional regulator, transcriptional repressor for pyruvate dehydrogenase complex